MFAGANAFNQPLNRWQLPNLLIATGMFYDSVMNHDLSCWNITNRANVAYFYTSAATDTEWSYAYDDDTTHEIFAKSELEATCWYNATSGNVDNAKKKNADHSLCNAADRAACTAEATTTETATTITTTSVTATTSETITTIISKTTTTMTTTTNALVERLTLTFNVDEPLKLFSAVAESSDVKTKLKTMVARLTGGVTDKDLAVTVQLEHPDIVAVINFNSAVHAAAFRTAFKATPPEPMTVQIGTEDVVMSLLQRTTATTTTVTTKGQNTGVTTTTAAITNPPIAPPASKSSGLSTGGLAAVIGGVVVLVLLVCRILYWKCQQRKKEKSGENGDGMGSLIAALML